ncbi:hypothetical protein BDZ94DRAFT_1309859 [Collybia nuda]|uniref:Uncharacterized protein n=1 Tax=Collybia nuda TaxID=64659 RepID=A0A9P5Y2H4_9AGAR|nr:hypothetical protein BDZ94DRAFT_1309859 [Collybia nuda]
MSTPFASLALIIGKPTQPGIDKLTITWTQQVGDPSQIALIPQCTRFTPRYIKLTAVILGNFTISIAELNLPQTSSGTGPCIFQAIDSRKVPSIPPLASDVISQSPPFEILQFLAPILSKAYFETAQTSGSSPTNANSPGNPSSTGLPSVAGATKSGSNHKTPTRGAVIGGIVGGATFVILLCTSIFLCRRKKRFHNGLGDEASHRLSQAYGFFLLPFTVLPFFRCIRQPKYSSNAQPLRFSGEYPRPEGKQERLERVQRGMEEVRRQHDALQSDPEGHGNGTGGSDNGVDRLKRQMEQLMGRIEEIEVIRRDSSDLHAPPDYCSQVGTSTRH